MDHLDHEGYQVHVVFGAAAMGVARKGVLVSESLDDDLEVVKHDLDSIWIALSNCLALHLEVTIDHRAVAIHAQRATSHGEEIVTLSVIIANARAFPLFLWLLHVGVSPVRILMAKEVDVVRVGHRCVAKGGREAVA